MTQEAPLSQTHQFSELKEHDDPQVREMVTKFSEMHESFAKTQQLLEQKQADDRRRVLLERVNAAKLPSCTKKRLTDMAGSWDFAEDTQTLTVDDVIGIAEEAAAASLAAQVESAQEEEPPEGLMAEPGDDRIDTPEKAKALVDQLMGVTGF